MHTKISKAFFDLVLISVGRKTDLDGPLSRAEWFEVYDIAKRQTLLGPLSVAIDRLDGVCKAPLAVYSKWMMAAEAIRKRNGDVEKVCRTLYSKFVGDGFRACVLKGRSISTYYPDPGLRQCADVDIWVEGGIGKVLPYLLSNTRVGEVVYHHCDVSKCDGVPVEVHFMPTWFNGFSRDRRLQRWFAANADAQYGNFDPDLGFSVPVQAFNAVFCLIHLLRHVLFEGIGLRQFMDYYYLLLSLPDAERREARNVLEGFGLGRFSGAVSYVLQTVFGLEKRYMLFAPDPKLGHGLLEEVMIAGNFGKFDARNTTRKSDPFFRRAFGRMTHLAGYVKFCPSEVLCAPGFKLWQYLWSRKYNR